MKILVITLSNIGDVVLTTGVLEGLKSKFPEAKIDLVVGELALGIFSSDIRINSVYPYKKSMSLLNRLKFFLNLKNNRYDLVIDLKDTFGSYLISLSLLRSKNVEAHAYIKHNMVLKRFFDKEVLKNFKPKVYWSSSDESLVASFMLKDYVVISALAKSLTKSWPLDYFKILIELVLRDYPDFDIVLTAGAKEKKVLDQLVIDSRVKNLSDKTTIPQLACLIKRAKVIITNDSAALHLASSVNTPSVAIFGPTSSIKYGPLADNSVILRRDYPCCPCERAQCIFSDKRCLKSIKPEYVLKALKELLEKRIYKSDRKYRRVLLSRTDRMGDLILTTAVIKVLREYLPNAYICFLTNSKLTAILKNNPYIDQVIGLDKEGKHKGILGFLKLLREIKRLKFDIVFNFHPTNRNHLLAFLSGIRERVGYDIKIGSLNNLKIEHKKQRSERSEAEYNFDLLKRAGFNRVELNQYLKPDKDALDWVDKELKEKTVEHFVIIHPGASCRSKLWELSNFVELSNRIYNQSNLSVIFVLGPDDTEIEKKLSKDLNFKFPVYFNISLERLIALISKASFMISNDSGPMHIADSLAKPLIAVFGRNQTGLSYKRWGPLGKKARVVYQDPGCKNCLAHNCDKGFICLKNISVDRVYNEFKSMEVEK